MGFENRVAVVTGGASRIGRALWVELARRGAIVVVADIRLAAAREVAAGIARASAAYLDVSKSADVQAVVDDTVRRHGRVDLMINNAGIGVGGEIRDLTLEHW